jgi:hypothetical protein
MLERNEKKNEKPENLSFDFFETDLKTLISILLVFFHE